MARSRAILMAKWGPHLTLFLIVGYVFLWAGVGLVFGDPLTVNQRMRLFGLLVVCLAITVFYQSWVMILLPGRTLEHGIAPPVPIKRYYLRSLVTPSSRLGSRLIGLLHLWNGLTSFWFALFLLASY
ncbi:hypothetical protein [Natrarchaeobaculum aegyptiacum]|uniref:Uncharacterized protein n=1 Tax=Natrarchaeobaculum aegyptiacum TaxID=745377 RepID=A0A2Z2HZ13_9EURY|nr:hypothetical protein [Natrarchaeobaculum aegyptiacum]ARS88848.1 hypothetical protein B1756_03145 [Natrarchaeobaculum aegyptiacum]